MVSGTVPGHRPILLLGRGFLRPSRSANFSTAACRSVTSRGAQRLALVALSNSTRVSRSPTDLRTNSTLMSGPSGRHPPTTGKSPGSQMSDPHPRHAIMPRFYIVPCSSRPTGVVARAPLSVSGDSALMRDRRTAGVRARVRPSEHAAGHPIAGPSPPPTPAPSAALDARPAPSPALTCQISARISRTSALLTSDTVRFPMRRIAQHSRLRSPVVCVVLNDYGRFPEPTYLSDKANATSAASGPAPVAMTTNCRPDRVR